MSTPTEPTAGRIIAGRYRLSRPLGRGGMGAVWSAEHLALRSEIAIKLIDPSVAYRKDLQERFLREAQAAASIGSLHVVQIFDYGIDDGVPYIAMELLRGESLAQRLARTHHLAPEQTLRVVRQVGRAIQKAHAAGIVHRDLKPDNIFLVREADEELAKVLDFGIAKVADPAGGESATRTGFVLGTPDYMSPEQARGHRAVDHRTDLWSLGVITYECLLGERPFTAAAAGDMVIKVCTEPEPVPSERGEVPSGFDAWFARALQKDPDQRFQAVDDLVNSLAAAVSGSGQPSPVGASTVALSPHAIHEALEHVALAPAGGSIAASSVTLHQKRAWSKTWVVAVLAIAVGGAASLLLLGEQDSDTPALAPSPTRAAAPPHSAAAAGAARRVEPGSRTGPAPPAPRPASQSIELQSPTAEPPEPPVPGASTAVPPPVALQRRSQTPPTKHTASPPAKQRHESPHPDDLFSDRF